MARVPVTYCASATQFPCPRTFKCRRLPSFSAFLWRSLLRFAAIWIREALFVPIKRFRAFGGTSTLKRRVWQFPPRRMLPLSRPEPPMMRIKPFVPAFAVLLSQSSILPGAKPGANSGQTIDAVDKVAVAVIPNAVRFDTVRFEVHAGGSVELTFQNGCVIPHNLVILRPGSESSVFAAVEALGAEGMEKGFVPDSPAVIVASKLLLSGQKQTLLFRAPEAPGEYPYVCTFPGHWFTMKGVMGVVPAGEKLAPATKDPSLKESSGPKVGDALRKAKISHFPLGSFEKPLVVRTFAPDPGLDSSVFAHHSRANEGIKYDPKTRTDMTRVVKNAAGEEVKEPVRVAAQPGIAGAIAVSHGPEFAYVWDSTECRLLYAWREGFLNMNPYWGKEPGGPREKNYIPKLVGRVVYKASGEAPLRLPQGAAPVFGGYRMVGGLPEFRYTLGGDVVRERVVPSQSGSFEIHVRIEGGPRQWSDARSLNGGMEVVPPEPQQVFVVRYRDAAP